MLKCDCGMIASLHLHCVLSGNSIHNGEDESSTDGILKAFLKCQMLSLYVWEIAPSLAIALPPYPIRSS